MRHLCPLIGFYGAGKWVIKSNDTTLGVSLRKYRQS